MMCKSYLQDQYWEIDTKVNGFILKESVKFVVEVCADGHVCEHAM